VTDTIDATHSKKQQQMQRSLSRLGQLTPVHAYRAGSTLEIFDGLKRARAAAELSWPTLRVHVHGLDAPGAKVALLLCNQTSALCELEEAWLVRSLYREDRLTQPEIAQLLCRHKSWVCRRLAMAEELSDGVTASVRLGLDAFGEQRLIERTCRELRLFVLERKSSRLDAFLRRTKLLVATNPPPRASLHAHRRLRIRAREIVSVG